MRYCLGRRPAKRPLGLRDFDHYLQATLPAGPDKLAAPAISDWGMLGNDRYGNCLGPGTRVLTADLRWVPVETVKIGDQLVGFDEFTADGVSRGFKVTTVERVASFEKPCFDVELEDGTVIRASADHQWLRHGGANDGRGSDWIATGDMVVGPVRQSAMCRVFDTWDEVAPDEYERGYLAGVLDGEGCLAYSSETGTVKSVLLAQRDNITLARAKEALDAYGFRYQQRHQASSSLSSNGYEQIVLGHRRQVVRLLGHVRPPRLLEKFDANRLGAVWSSKVRLVEKKDVGIQEVVAIQTDARTFIAEGFLSHNCTIAGLVHLRMANASQNSEQESWPTADQVVQTYLTLSGGADSGLVEADVLHTWYVAGLFNDKISGYAPVNQRDFDELKSVTAAFGGAYLGVVLPEPAQDQFASGQPWDITGTGADRQIEGGHCVPMVGYDANYAYLVTWGRLQSASWRWMDQYLEESWAVLTSEDARVNLDSLQKDLALIH